MLVPAGSPIFFLREHRFAVRCRVVTLRHRGSCSWTLFTLLFMSSTCLLNIFLYIFFINIGCATLYHLSMMYVTVYNMSFNSNCRILAAELNYRFTVSIAGWRKWVATAFGFCEIPWRVPISSIRKRICFNFNVIKLGVFFRYLLKENPSTNLEKKYTSPYRSFNFQYLFFYDIFWRNAYITSYRSSNYTSIRQY